MGIRGSGLSYANGGAWVAPYAIDGSSQKPYTIFAWVKDTTGSGNIGGTFGGFGNTAGASVAVLNGYQSNFYAVDVNDGNTPVNANLSLPNATGWLPLAAVFKSPASRTAYAKDGQTATDTTTLPAPQSFNAIGLGDYISNSGNSSPVPSNTVMAEFAIWKTDLGPKEVALLQSGVSPLRVRPEALLCYFPLRSDFLDHGPLGLKLSGPTPVWGEHPPVAPTDMGLTRSMPMFKATSAVAGSLTSSTSAAVLSAGATRPVRGSGATPVVVQSAFVQGNAPSTASIVLPQAPTPGNHILFMATGSSVSPFSTITPPPGSRTLLADAKNATGQIAHAWFLPVLSGQSATLPFQLSGAYDVMNVFAVEVSGARTPATRPATVTFNLSEDAYSGDAVAQLFISGRLVDTVTVTASHAAGQTQPFTYTGDFGDCILTASVTFTNDSYGGSASTDRNLWLDSIVVNGTQAASTTFLGGTGDTYTIEVAAQPDDNPFLIYHSAPSVSGGVMTASGMLAWKSGEATRLVVFENDSPVTYSQSGADVLLQQASATAYHASALVAPQSTETTSSVAYSGSSSNPIWMAVDVVRDLAYGSASSPMARSAAAGAGTASSTPPQSATLSATATPSALSSAASVAVRGILAASTSASVASAGASQVGGTFSKTADPAVLAASASAAQVLAALSVAVTSATLTASAGPVVQGALSAAAGAAILSAIATLPAYGSLSQSTAPAVLSSTSNAAQVAASVQLFGDPASLSATFLAQQPAATLARTVSASSSATAAATQPALALSKTAAFAGLSGAALAQQPSAGLARTTSATAASSARVAVAATLSRPSTPSLAASAGVKVSGGATLFADSAAASAAILAVQPQGTLALSMSSVPDDTVAVVDISGYVYQVVFDAISAFAIDPVTASLEASASDVGFAGTALSHPPRASLSRSQSSVLVAYGDIVSLARLDLTTHNAGVSAECVALYQDSRDGVVLPSTALDFLPSGIAAKPLYSFLGPLIDQAMTPDNGVNEVFVDPLVGPLLLDFQEAEAVNAYLNLLVHPVVGTRRSLDYALQLLEVGPYITEWWQPNVQSRFDQSPPVAPSDRAFHFTVTFPDGSLPKKSFDYRSLIRMLFALKNERSRLVSVRMADCVDILTLDNDCELDKFWMDSLEGFVDEETGVVICLHEDFTQRIDASEHVAGALLTSWRTDTTHAFCSSLLDFTALDDDTIMDGGSFEGATAHTSQRVLRGFVVLRNLDFQTGLYTKPQGRTSSTVAIAGGSDIAARTRIARTRDSVQVSMPNLAPVAHQTISLRLTSQRITPESFYAQRAWNDRPNGSPRIWAEPGQTWLSSQPQGFCQRTSETLPNWFFGTGANTVARPGGSGVLFYGVIGSGGAVLRALGAAAAAKVSPAGPAAAALRRPVVVSGAKAGTRASGALRFTRPSIAGSGQMQPRAFGLLSLPLPVAAGQGVHSPDGGQTQGSGGSATPAPGSSPSSSPVVRNTATTAAPVTLLALRTQAAPTVSPASPGESAEGTTVTSADGVTNAAGSIITYEGTVLTLQNSGAGTEVFANGADMHMVEGNYGRGHYPFPTTLLKWHNHRLSLRTTQKGFDDWSICYGADSPGVWNTCYIVGEDPSLTATYVDPVAYDGTQPFPLGTRVGNPDQSGYNGGMAETTSMLGPVQLINVFNAFNQEWDTWGQAAESIAGNTKGNPISAAMLPVIGIKMARNYCGYYTNSLGDPSGHDNNKEFKDIIAGIHDAHITAVADAWHRRYSKAYWRIAYEFNGGFMPDFFGGQNGDTATLPLWIAAFQRTATLIRASAAKYGAKARIIWNPNLAQYSDTLVENAWPGDAYVDVVGFDQYSPVYNNATGGAGLYDWSKDDGSTCADNPTWVSIPENRISYWDYGSGDQYARGSGGLGGGNQFGMQYALNFIKDKGKPLLMCETGAGNTHTDGGSDPFRGPVDDPVFPLWLRSRLDQAVNMGIPVIGAMIWCANESDGGWGFLGLERRRQAQAWSAAFGGTTAAAMPSFGP